MAVTRSITGAELKIYINNRIFGVCDSLSWTVDSGRRSIRGLDSNEPYEIAEGPATIQGSMQVKRLRRDGGLEGRGLMGLPHQFSLEKYISIRILERKTEAVVFATDRALLTNQSWRVGVKGLLTGSFNFECIGYINESAA